MTRIGTLLFAVAAATLVGFALYLGLIRSPIAAGWTILFYRGVALALLAAAILAALLALAGRRWDALDPPTVVACAAVSLSFNMAFLILLPVTIDRSISVFLLSRIDRSRLAPPDTAQLRGAFERDYVVGMRQIERRVREQAASGNIRVTDGRITLTPQGERFLRVSRTLARLFGTDPRFVGLAPPTADAPAGPPQRKL